MAFPAFLIPFAKALAVNTGKNVLTGQDPLKNAGNALISGGIMGGIGGEFAGADAVSGVGSPTGGVAGAGAVPTSAIVPNSIESSGMVFNPSTGTYLNPENFIGASTPFATYTGGEGLLSNAMGNITSTLPDYVTPQNLVGAANILSQSQPQQMPMQAPRANVSRGNMPQGNIDYGMARPIKRRGLL